MACFCRRSPPLPSPSALLRVRVQFPALSGRSPVFSGAPVGRWIVLVSGDTAPAVPPGAAGGATACVRDPNPASSPKLKQNAEIGQSGGAERSATQSVCPRIQVKLLPLQYSSERGGCSSSRCSARGKRVNKSRNPTPWENVDPTKPQKLITVSQKWEPVDELQMVKRYTK
ncbi:normal mucosa of esophagus-specific gene 1 protein isoform X1 [Mobula hypostoma]|uniref:normal mucosa of esophagus-specific gene 1 protein isoform X1 n=1 Tax=Mobula hypostoma TaxID=723540 RepID=UPI002FC3212F